MYISVPLPSAIVFSSVAAAEAQSNCKKTVDKMNTWGNMGTHYVTVLLANFGYSTFPGSHQEVLI